MEYETPSKGNKMTPGKGNKMTPGKGNKMTPGKWNKMTPGKGNKMTPGKWNKMTPGKGNKITPRKGTVQGVQTRTSDLKATHYMLLPLFALVYKDLNHIQVILDKPHEHSLKCTSTWFNSP